MVTNGLTLLVGVIAVWTALIAWRVFFWPVLRRSRRICALRGHPQFRVGHNLWSSCPCGAESVHWTPPVGGVSYPYGPTLYLLGRDDR